MERLVWRCGTRVHGRYALMSVVHRSKVGAPPFSKDAAAGIAAIELRGDALCVADDGSLELVAVDVRSTETLLSTKIDSAQLAKMGLLDPTARWRDGADGSQRRVLGALIKRCVGQAPQPQLSQGF